MRKASWILLLATLSPAAYAEEFLKLDELIQQVLKQNPEIQAAQKKVEAVRQRPAQEGALPEPTLSLGYTSNGGPLPGQGIGREPTSNAGFSVTQDLPYPGKRRLASGIAAKEADAELQQYFATERTVVSRMKQAFHKLHHTYQALDILERNRDLMTRFLKLGEIRYAAGKAMQQDIFKAQTQLAIVEINIVKMQQDLAMAEAEINALLNLPVDAPVARPAHVLPHKLETAIAELLKQAEASAPQLRKDQKMIEARQLGVSLARKNFYPDFAVSGGYFYMGSMADMFQFRLDLKLPVYRSKQRAALTEQVQSLAQTRKSYEAAETELRRGVQDLYIAAQSSWRLMELYRDTVLPQGDLTVQSSLASYETGSLESMPVLMNMVSKLEQEERFHEEMLNYFIAVIRLEEITGMELL